MKKVFMVVKMVEELRDGLQIDPDNRDLVCFRGTHCWSASSEEILSMHLKWARAEASMRKLLPERILIPANPGVDDGLVEYYKSVTYEIRKFRVGDKLHIREEDEDEED